MTSVENSTAHRKPSQPILAALAWRLIFASALLLVVIHVFATPPVSGVEIGPNGEEIWSDNFFYVALGAPLTTYAVSALFVGGLALRGFAPRWRMPWLVSIVLVVLGWCLWAQTTVTLSGLARVLGVGRSSMFYEENLTGGLCLAAAAPIAAFIAISVVKLAARLLDRHKHADLPQP